MPVNEELDTQKETQGEIDDSDFDAIFDSLVEDDDPTETTDDGDTSEESSQDDTEGQSEDESQQGEGVDATSKNESQESDWKALYEREVQRTKSWDGRLRVADTKIKELEDELRQTKESQKAKPSQSSPSGEDDEVLKDFLEEFPDLVKPLSVLIDRKAKEQAESLINDKLGEFTPIKATVEKQMADNHFKAISDAHPDWQELVQAGSVQSWIESQPMYMQEPLNKVYRMGSTDEVIDLLTRFKQSNGGGSSVNQQSNNKPSKKDKISSAVAVQTGRALPPKREPDPDDFDGTWERITRS